MIDLNLNPSKKELRTFGLCALAFAALVAWLVFRRTGSVTVGVSIASVGVALALLGLAIPRALRPVWVVLMVVNYPIGWVITHVVMAMIFYLVVTPVGTIMRLTGRDPMERAFDRRAKTYWKTRRSDPDSACYFRQY
ncbi:MAG TPA: SxtJ family membrane protein [Planctomycetaceae bacterium]|nr:SxtJ family membrane protein [Planctomycetaceae bacterium]